MLAPLALIVFVVAFVVVLSKSGVSSSGSGSPSSPPPTSTTASSPKHNKFAHRRTYRVRTGDTLGAIAQRTGVSVTDLETLNPGLDPQGLVAGQKIKLRE
jgi:LysM repeat protein